MDRLVKVDSLDLSLYFTPNHRSSTTFHLTNLMHTMSVAVSLTTTTTTTTSIFTLSHPYTVLPPLSTTLFTLSLTHPLPSPPPISTSLLVRTSILPTGKAHQDDLRRLFSKPGSHIFKDATLPISFIGHHVVHHLLSSPLPSNSLELSFSLTKAISACSAEQLTELLHLAVKNSQKTSSVSALIVAGADVNSRDADGRSVLYFPIRSGDFELVRILIESGCVIDVSKDLFLHFAAEMDRIDLMEVLLNHSVNSIALVQNLVTNSINLDQSPFSSKRSAKSVDGSPFQSKKSVSPFLLKRLANSVDGSPFMSKGSVNSVGQTEAQLRNSVSLVKSVDSAGRTPLHVSAFHGHIEAMKLCVSMGGDPDCVDFDGWTPLHCAAAKGHVECVEYLLECCSYSKYSINNDRKTPFMLAVDNGHSGLMDLLQLGDALNRSARVDDVNGLKNCIEEGVNVNLKDQNGWTPLHRAAFKGRIECVKILLSQGAKIDVVDDVGYTPLHCAIEAGKVEVALCLIAHGARANSKSLKGVCSLNLESFKNHPAFVSPMRSGKELA